MGSSVRWIATKQQHLRVLEKKHANFLFFFFFLFESGRKETFLAVLTVIYNHLVYCQWKYTVHLDYAVKAFHCLSVELSCLM